MPLVWIPSVDVDSISVVAVAVAVDGIRNFVTGGLDEWAALKSCCLAGRLSAETAFAGGIDIAAAPVPVGAAVGVVPFRSISA